MPFTSVAQEEMDSIEQSVERQTVQARYYEAGLRLGAPKALLQ